MIPLLMNNRSSKNVSARSRISIFFPDIGGKPVGGAYRFETSNTAALDYTFNLPDQSAAEDSIVVLVPTVELNAGRTIHSVAWDAFHRDMSPMENIHHIFSNLEVQIDTADEPIGEYSFLEGGSTRVYNSGNVPATDEVNILSVQPILWEDVKTIFFGYNDLYGNHYVLRFDK